MLPQGSPQAAAMMAHIQEHTAMAYLLEMQRVTGIRFEMPSDDEEDRELPPEAEAQIAMLAASAVQQMEQEQAAQQAANQPPDPALLAAQADAQRKDAVAASEQQRKDAVAQSDAQRKDTVALLDATRADRTETQALAERIAQQEAGLMGSSQ
jgi:hypothetical protein